MKKGLRTVREDWPPVSVEDAESERLSLVAECEAIQTQLASRDMRRADGSPMLGAEYDDWRVRALSALSIRRDRQRRLSKWIDDRRRRDSSDGEWRLLADMLHWLEAPQAADEAEARSAFVRRIRRILPPAYIDGRY